MISIDNISDADEYNFKQSVLDMNGLVLVYFWAPWCGPCKLMSWIIQELATEFPTVRFVKLNTDDAPAVPTMYYVSGIPSFLLFKSSTVVDQLVGAVHKSKIATMLQKHV